VTSSITNVFYDFHDSLESQVQNALQCSPIWFTENNDTINESEVVIKEGEKHETDSLPEVIDDLSTRPFKIIKKRRTRGSLRNDRRKIFLKKMLERFQRETGQLEAKAIYWKLLDRSRIPSEYDGIKIDSHSMSRTEYFDNPDIVDNIHFKPCTDDRLDSKADASNIVLLKIRRRLLEIFRTDSDRPNAEKVIWDRIDSDRLPEKYKNILLTSRTVYGQKFYEDLEFMENVHFKPYTKSYAAQKRKYEN
jgi:hypothetical protein